MLKDQLPGDLGRLHVVRRWQTVPSYTASLPADDPANCSPCRLHLPSDVRANLSEPTMPAKGTMMAKKHPGFAKVQKSIEKEGYSKDAAGAILASKSRGASAKAHKANPRLNKVKGGKY